MSGRELDALPVEMLTLILRELDLPELANCRLISKKFKFSVDQVRVNELAVIVDRFQYLKSLPFKYDACEPIVYPNLLCLLNPKLFSSSLASAVILKNLRYFKLTGYVNWQQFNITALNGLDKLKQLDFDCSIVIDGIVQLALASLEVLSFAEAISRRNRESEDHLRIDAAKLRVFACQRLDDCIQIVHPQTIEKLELNTSNQNLSVFVNLKVFQQNFGTAVHGSLLSSLSGQLRELHIYLRNFLGAHVSVHYPYLKETVTELLRQRAVLERRDLKIFLMGIEVIETRKRDVDDFDEQFLCYLKFNRRKSFFPLSRSYKQLADTLPFYESVDFGLLETLGYERIPDDFCSRFMNLREVISRGCVLNQVEFTSFLSRIKHLSQLSIVDSTMLFDRRFFEQLPSICPLLSKLVLYEESRRDFSFILRFKMLVEFETNKRQWLRYAPDAYRACKYLNSFQVRNENKPFVKIRQVLNGSLHGYIVINAAVTPDYSSPLKLEELNELCKRFCGDLED